MLRMLDRWLARLAGASTAGLVVVIALVAADIVIRKIFSRSLVGTVDLTELALVVSAFLSIPLVFARRAQVSVEIATDRLPRRGREFLDGVGALMGAALFAAIGVLAIQPARMSAMAGDVSQDLAIPLAWYWVPAIAGCFAAAVAALAMAVSHFAHALRGTGT